MSHKFNFKPFVAPDFKIRCRGQSDCIEIHYWGGKMFEGGGRLAGFLRMKLDAPHLVHYFHGEAGKLVAWHEAGALCDEVWEVAQRPGRGPRQLHILMLGVDDYRHCFREQWGRSRVMQTNALLMKELRTLLSGIRPEWPSTRVMVLELPTALMPETDLFTQMVQLFSMRMRRVCYKYKQITMYVETDPLLGKKFDGQCLTPVNCLKLATLIASKLGREFFV